MGHSVPNVRQKLHLSSCADFRDQLLLFGRSGKVGIVMQYFDESDDKYERIGKVIGDAFAAFIVITVITVIAVSMLYR